MRDPAAVETVPEIDRSVFNTISGSITTRHGPGVSSVKQKNLLTAKIRNAPNPN